jgi:hypothetical protein
MSVLAMQLPRSCVCAVASARARSPFWLRVQSCDLCVAHQEEMEAAHQRRAWDRIEEGTRLCPYAHPATLITPCLSCCTNHAGAFWRRRPLLQHHCSMHSAAYCPHTHSLTRHAQTAADRVGKVVSAAQGRVHIKIREIALMKEVWL